MDGPTIANMTVILPTTPEVGIVCDELERGIGRFLDSRSTLPPLGRYESQVEALNLFYLALRDIEGVVALARNRLSVDSASARISESRL